MELPDDPAAEKEAAKIAYKDMLGKEPTDTELKEFMESYNPGEGVQGDADNAINELDKEIADAETGNDVIEDLNKELQGDLNEMEAKENPLDELADNVDEEMAPEEAIEENPVNDVVEAADPEDAEYDQAM